MTSSAWLALPPAAVTLAAAIVAGAEIAGSHPLTLAAARNASEAIAMGDAAAAARLIERGAGISDIGVIRSGVLGERPVLATPIEVAVMRDQAAMVDYLVAHGAAPPPHLPCLAADAGARSVLGHVGTDPTCHRGEALRAVLSRP
jgi:hypothetical protein